MAVLTAPQLQDLRNLAASVSASVTWTKPQVNAALQAIEDRMTGATNVGGKTVQQAIAADIEAAAPGVFTVAQKQVLFALWCVRYATRVGVL